MMEYRDVFGLGWGWEASLFSSLAILLIWALFWKGLALWHSARRGHPWWFVAMLFLNTAGILEIIYLFTVAKVKGDQLFSKK